MDKPENINILVCLRDTHTKSHAQKKVFYIPGRQAVSKVAPNDSYPWVLCSS